MTPFSSNLSASLHECEIQRSPLKYWPQNTLLHYDITFEIAFPFLLDLELELWSC